MTLQRSPRLAVREARLAWMLMTPALAVLTLVAAGPLLASVWESLHRYDARLPWLGRPFVGLANYERALTDPRFLAAFVHTAVFTGVSVLLEMLCGFAFALAIDALVRGRGIARAAMLVPWALPAVVAALIWRFLFDGRSGVVNAALASLGYGGAREWLADPIGAWIPIVLGDVWKTTPFVALLLLAGLQSIDASLYEAARIDGAPAFRRFFDITLPLMRPALVVALVFRTLDAFRVFDLVYVLTGGGPGVATDVVSLYAFTTLLRNLQFGYASALAVLVFIISFTLALVYIRVLGASVADAR